MRGDEQWLRCKTHIPSDHEKRLNVFCFFFSFFFIHLNCTHGSQIVRFLPMSSSKLFMSFISQSISSTKSPHKGTTRWICERRNSHTKTSYSRTSSKRHDRNSLEAFPLSRASDFRGDDVIRRNARCTLSEPFFIEEKITCCLSSSERQMNWLY